MRLPATTSFELTDNDSWCNFAADIVARCLKKGATAADVGIASGKGYQLNVRHGEVETLEFNRDTALTLTVYLGQQSGSVSLSGDLQPDTLDEAISKALTIAQYTGQDPYAGLANKSLMAKNYPELDLYFPWDIDIEEAINLAKNCEAEALAYDNRITNSDGVSISTHKNIQILANSNDFAGAYHKTSHSISCSLIAESKGHMQADGDYTSHRDANELTSINILAKQAAERTVGRLDARSLATGRYPVIFHATVAKSLIGHMMQAIAGSNIYNRATFLVDKLGQPICASHITLCEYPHLAKGPGSAPFDAEGVRTSNKTVVEKGILQHYLLSSYSGRQLNMPTTANAGGVRNLIISNQDISFEELLAQMDTGLLVMGLMGQGVNIVTGDYSRGAHGYWVEKGKIAYPVEEITIASNLKDIFMHIQTIANDIDKRGNIQTGSILIETMMIAGNKTT